jgi:hypothetical protein
MRTALGYHSETFSRVVRPSAANPVGGRRYYTPFAILAGKTITNIDIGVHTAGATLSMVKVGVASLDAVTLHCVSGDEKAQYTSTGLKTNPVLVPYTSPIDQVLYGVFFATGTTTPGIDMGFGSGRGSNAKKSGAAAAPCATVNLQSDLLAGGSLQSDSGSVPIWMGFS